MSDQTPESLEPVTVESDDGRIFTGVGVTPEALAETMDAREKPEPAEPLAPSPQQKVSESPESATPDPTPLKRDPDTGQFKKPTRGQKRFAEMKRRELEAVETATKSERELRTAAEQKAAALEARLTALESGRTPEPAAPSPPKPAGTRDKPSEDEIGAKYTTYAEFVEDLADWKAEQRIGADVEARIQARFDQQQMVQTAAQRQQSVYERTVQTYPDFDAVRQAHPDAANVQFPADTWQALISAPHAEHLMYTLASDPALARTIAEERNPIRLGMLLGSLRPPERVARPASTPRAVTSSAPSPYQPVGTGSKTTAPSLSDLANAGDDYDSSGYREARAAQRRGVRR